MADLGRWLAGDYRIPGPSPSALIPDGDELREDSRDD